MPVSWPAPASAAPLPVGDGFGPAVVRGVLDLAEVGGVEDLLEADDPRALGGGPPGVLLVLGDHRLRVAGPAGLHQRGTYDLAHGLLLAPAGGTACRSRARAGSLRPLWQARALPPGGARRFALVGDPYGGFGAAPRAARRSRPQPRARAAARSRWQDGETRPAAASSSPVTAGRAVASAAAASAGRARATVSSSARPGGVALRLEEVGDEGDVGRRADAAWCSSVPGVRVAALAGQRGRGPREVGGGSAASSQSRVGTSEVSPARSNSRTTAGCGPGARPRRRSAADRRRAVAAPRSRSSLAAAARASAAQRGSLCGRALTSSRGAPANRAPRGAGAAGAAGTAAAAPAPASGAPAKRAPRGVAAGRGCAGRPPPRPPRLTRAPANLAPRGPRPVPPRRRVRRLRAPAGRRGTSRHPGRERAAVRPARRWSPPGGGPGRGRPRAPGASAAPLLTARSRSIVRTSPQGGPRGPRRTRGTPRDAGGRRGRPARPVGERHQQGAEVSTGIPVSPRASVGCRPAFDTRPVTVRYGLFSGGGGSAARSPALDRHSTGKLASFTADRLAWTS